ncbi:NRDE family protein [soil metagenome]
MCLIAFEWRPDRSFGRRLTLAANRDEFFHRETLPLRPWAERDDILAGADLGAERGADGLPGTWLGVTRSGRFAALTNVRGSGEKQPRSTSRGHLVSAWLAGRMPAAEYLLEVQARAQRYNGFNLLLGQLTGHQPQLWSFSNRGNLAPERLRPGIYCVSNAALDTPWPKLTRALARFTLEVAASVETRPLAPQLFTLLADTELTPDDELPDTGVSLEWERALSAVFIRGEQYGTRSSQVLTVMADGQTDYRERRFGPLGEAQNRSVADSVWQFAATE